MTRGQRWLEALADAAPQAHIPSVVTGETTLGDTPATLIAVVPDPGSPFPRARHGEVGLREGLALAEIITGITSTDREPGPRRAIVAVVDLPSQAYGRTEERYGIHWALAAAIDAYATARRAGHPLVTLVVGTALSGGFLAHGLQAAQILALDDPGVEIHAMHKPAAARITRRSVAELDELAAAIPPLSYQVRDWATLGLCRALLAVRDADQPTRQDVTQVRAALADAVTAAQAGPQELSSRLDNAAAGRLRGASRAVRDLLAAQWPDPHPDPHPGPHPVAASRSGE